jgi:hypothetical protein
VGSGSRTFEKKFSTFEKMNTRFIFLYTVRGVGSGSRDVEAWRANDCTSRIGVSKYRCPWSMTTPHRT